MAEVIPEPQQNLAAQVQQLLKMNESLVKTNESLKEMVISVVELLKDPSRNLMYPGDFLKSNATDGQNLQDASDSFAERLPLKQDFSPTRNTDLPLRRAVVPQASLKIEETSTYLSEQSSRMTAQEIQDEDDSFKQKYKEIWEGVDQDSLFTKANANRDPWHQHWVRAQEVLNRHFFYRDPSDESLMRSWNGRAGSFIVDAMYIGSNDGKALLRNLAGETITVSVEDLSDADIQYLVQMTGTPWGNIKEVPGRPIFDISRTSPVLDDIYEAIFHNFAQSACPSLTRYHVETLLSPVILKILIRVRFVKPIPSYGPHDDLRGVIIIGRCLQNRECIPTSGSQPRPWNLRYLHQACHLRGLFELTKTSSPPDTAGIGGEHYNAEMVKEMIWIYRIVCAMNMWNKFEDLVSEEATKRVSENVDVPLHDLFQRDSNPANTPDQFSGAEGPSFPRKDVNYQTLKALGNLEIRWTDNYADHLKLSSTKTGKRLHVFWDRTPYDLNNGAYYKNIKPHKEELSRTFALIFGPYSSALARKGRQLVDPKTSKKIIDLQSSMSAPDPLVMTFTQPNGSYVWRDVHLWREPAKSILEAYMVIPIPIEEECIFGGYFFYPFAEESKKAPKISQIMKYGHPYPASILFPLEGILRNCHLLEEYEDYNSYPVFGNRLRVIKAFMDSRKPRGFFALWKDKRDSLQWYTFWAVLIVGSLSIFLAFASVAISAAQTVAAFKQLDVSTPPPSSPH